MYIVLFFTVSTTYTTNNSDLFFTFCSSNYTELFYSGHKYVYNLLKWGGRGPHADFHSYGYSKVMIHYNYCYWTTVNAILANDCKSVLYHLETEHNDIALNYSSFSIQIPRGHTFIVIW